MAKKVTIKDLNLTDTEVREWISLVKIALTNIQLNFSSENGLILTEGDLECIMYNELIKENLGGPNNPFSQYYFDKPKVKRTRMVHSQVTWFKPLETSGFRVDLTIFDPKNAYLSEHDDVEVWPNKGFFHDGKVLAIELKFIRTHVSGKIEEMVTEDLNKIVTKIIPAKVENINNGTYENVSPNNVAFMIVVGCKSEEIYSAAIKVIDKYIDDNNLRNLNYIDFFIFSPNPKHSKFLMKQF